MIDRAADGAGLSTAGKPSTYRPDIDGLRAVAVLAVVFYHYGIGPLAGGFVGVDIFFVISGFLITGIVQKEIAQGRFTFAGFYQRRVRRLFPALFVVLLATLLVGLVTLLPTDLALLGRSVMATVLFVSNIFFWRNSGYFDGDAENNPLLHTWSLAVEEQFYIVFPVVLLLIHRYIPGRLRMLLWLAAAGSFALCVVVQNYLPSATFYLSPFRAWELCLGALLAVGALPKAERRWQRECIAGLGALLIAYAVLFVQPDERFPGWRAALPVLGAAMIIHAGSAGDSLVQRALRIRPMVFVGLISYSLYLWHWPLLVYANFVNHMNELGPLRWLLLVAAVSLASASYFLVEKPFRGPRKANAGKPLFIGAAALSCTLLITGAATVRSHGLPERLPPAVAALDEERTPEVPFLDCIDRPLSGIGFEESCRLGKGTVEPSVLFWGDSHALAWSPAIDRLMARQGMSAIFAGRSACAPLLGIINPEIVECHDHNRAVMRQLLDSPEISTVILAASWAGYANADGHFPLRDDAGNEGNAEVFPRALRNTVTRLRSGGKRVWLIGPTPTPPGDVPLLMSMAAWHGDAMPPPVSLQEHKRKVAAFYRVAEALPAGSDLLLSRPGAWLCDASGCLYEVSDKPLYRDDGHLSLFGAKYLLPKLEKSFWKFQSDARPADDNIRASTRPGS